MKWWELVRWNKSKVNKIWSYLLMRRRHLSKDKGNSKSMRKNLSEDMEPSNNQDQTSFKLWKRLPKPKEKQFSKNSPPKNQPEELKPNMLKIWETTYKFKKTRKESVHKRDLIMKRKLDKNTNFRLPRIISSNLRPRDLLKKREWKTNSRSKWLRSLLRMSVWSKWTPKREEWENNSTKETSNNYGKKNFLYIVSKENKNGKREG